MRFRLTESIGSVRHLAWVLAACLASSTPASADELMLDLEPAVRPGHPHIIWQGLRVHTQLRPDHKPLSHLNLNGMLTGVPNDFVIAYRLRLSEKLVKTPADDRTWTRLSPLVKLVNPSEQQNNKDNELSIHYSNLQLKLGHRLPTRLTGYLDLLQAAASRTIELPLADGAEQAIDPGLGILISDLRNSGRSHYFQVKLTTAASDPEIRFGSAPWLWHLEALDETGRIVRSNSTLRPRGDGEFDARIYAYEELTISSIRVRLVTRVSERSIRFELDEALLQFPPAPDQVAGPVEILQPPTSVGKATLRAANLHIDRRDRNEHELKTYRVHYIITPSVRVELLEEVDLVSYRKPRLINVIDEHDRNILALTADDRQRLQQASRLNRCGESKFDYISGKPQRLVRLPKTIKRVTGDIALMIARQQYVERLEPKPGSTLTMPDDGTVELIEIDPEDEDDTQIKLRYEGGYIYYEPQLDRPFIREIHAVTKQGKTVTGSRRSWSRRDNDGVMSGHWTFEFNKTKPQDISHIHVYIVSDTETVVLPFASDIDWQQKTKHSETAE